jgi:hypothetical protein
MSSSFLSGKHILSDYEITLENPGVVFGLHAGFRRRANRSRFALAATTNKGWRYVETRRFPAPEARQGVAADDKYLYVISNHALGKYRKDTGERVNGWECPKGEPLTHLNAGIVRKGRLYCAHSNFPGVPMLSSVEIWDTATMKHVGNHSFGRTDGSLTWIDRRNGGGSPALSITATKGASQGAGPSGRAWSSSMTSGDRPAAGLSPPISWRNLGCAASVFPAALWSRRPSLRHRPRRYRALRARDAGSGSDPEVDCDHPDHRARPVFRLGSARPNRALHLEQARPGGDCRTRGVGKRFRRETALNQLRFFSAVASRCNNGQ